MLTTLLFAGAIGVGGLIGAAGIAVPADPFILLLVGAIFFTLRFDGLTALRRAPRTMLIAIAANFVLVPIIALPISMILPSDALRLGVLIYCLAPCTDWFLGFTRLAGGDTATGAALIPVQMLLQLLMYPVWMALFVGESVDGASGRAARNRARHAYRVPAPRRDHAPLATAGARPRARRIDLTR